MSADALPIEPARFAEALKDLTLSSLHLKVLEIRNSIAHLDYSNEQLRPFAEGMEAVLGPSGASSTSDGPGAPDQDCVDAIRENEAVIDKMQERIRLVRVEVEGRGVSWTEFQSKEEAEAAAAAAAAAAAEAQTNGVNGHGQNGATHAPNPWADGTFQTGVIRNGEVQMDAEAGQRVQPGHSAAGAGGGRLSDEELRRMLEERLNHQDDDDDDDEEGGMHL